MRHAFRAFLAVAIGILAGCSDDLDDNPRLDGGESLTDSGASDAGTAADAEALCDVGESLDGQCVTEKFYIFMGARGALLTSVASVPESGLREPEDREGTDINAQCTLYAGTATFTPEPYDCPGLGSLVLSQGSDELEVTSDERCYGAVASKPWAGDEVTATWSGDEFPAGSVTATLPEPPVVEIGTTDDGGVSLTRTNTEAWPTWQVTLYSTDEQYMVCDVESTDVVEFSADDVALLTQGDVAWGFEAVHDDPDGKSVAAGSLEVNLSGFAFSTGLDVF